MSKWVEGKVVTKTKWTERLYSLQVDAAVEPFLAGQFGKLALEINGEMVGRPYSFVNAPGERPLEFYFNEVPGGPLSHRLTVLESGQGIFLAPKAAGFLVLSEIRDAENLWLLSTGTALGPFLSILKTEEAWHRFRNIALVHAVRRAQDLSYSGVIRGFQARQPERFKFVPFVSREETDFAIQGRVPDALRDGRLEARTGLKLMPDNSQVMICGNPDMVRDTQTALEERGLRKNRRKEPGQISVENYW